MFSNYLKIALRNLVRHKGYAVVNILGLAVGFAACLTILGFVQFERSFDKYNEHADRIYRVEKNVQSVGGMERWAYTYRNMAAYLKDAYPEIEEATRIGSKDEPVVKQGNNQFYESNFIYGEPSLFDLFDITLQRGVPADLSRPGTMLLSASTARKYFSATNPVGQNIEVSNKWDQTIEHFEIVGVFEDLLANSHFSANFIASMATVDEAFSDMNRSLVHTYYMVAEGADADLLTAKIEDVNLVEAFGERMENMSLHTIPLTNIHLYGEAKTSTDIQLQGDIQLVYLFSFIALLIIVLACINYMNLATARAAQRSREVGVRKVVGAARKQLFLQFVGESMIFVVLALGLGIGLAQLSLPLFQQILNQSFAFNWTSFEFLGAIAAGTLIVGFVAGSYPAVLLSGFQPSSVLKGQLGSRNTWPVMRKALVVFQFAVSIAFIVGTFVIYQQLNYATEQRLGFDQDQKMILMTRSRLNDSSQAFRDALLAQSGVQDVSMSSGIPGHPSMISFFAADKIEGQEDNPEGFFDFDHIYVDYEFVNSLGLNIVEGRAFSTAFASDEDAAYIINETAAKELGWETAAGKVFDDNGTKKSVVGVVEDFHMRHMREEIRPLILEIGDYSRFVTLTVDSRDLSQSLAGLNGLWETFIPSIPFQYSFLEDEVEALYREEQRLGVLISLFSGLAVLVACLGLFGLAAYTSARRTKEIGIRKTLGASTTGLVRLLSADYLKLLCWAFVVATPVAYFTMQSWLDSFVYRVSLHWWVFVGAGVVALLVAVLAVSYQSIKTALANPVQALRYE